MSSSRRGFFRELAAAAARAAIPDEEEPAPEPVRTPLLSEAEMERYSRQLVLPEWTEMAQIALRDASVLVIGTGALGSPVALYLAGAGVGRLGVVDDDDVEISNLHRQPLHYTPDMGVPKAESAASKLRFLNPDIVVEPYRMRVDSVNAPGLIDPGYRGEVRVLLLNTDPTLEFQITPGDRIAQLLLVPVAHATPLQADALDESTRGAGGFGSTGS